MIGAMGSSLAAKESGSARGGKDEGKAAAARAAGVSPARSMQALTVKEHARSGRGGSMIKRAFCPFDSGHRPSSAPFPRRPRAKGPRRRLQIEGAARQCLQMLQTFASESLMYWEQLIGGPFRIDERERQTGIAKVSRRERLFGVIFLAAPAFAAVRIDEGERHRQVAGFPAPAGFGAAVFSCRSASRLPDFRRRV